MAGREKAATKKESAEHRDELMELEKTNSRLVRERDELRDRNSRLLSENESLKKAAQTLQAETKSLKTAMNKSELQESKDDYLEIVAVPPVRGMKMGDILVNGVVAQPTTDEEGFSHFVVPKKTARALLAYTGSRHVLVGPVDFVDFTVPTDRYAKNVRCLRHKMVKEGSIIKWVPVVVE
jgi:predicted nuclease with TOPRIM domain